MFCQKCGNEIKEDMLFCPKCGNQITGSKTMSNSVAGKTVSKFNLMDYKKYIIIAIAIVLVIVLGKKILGGLGSDGGYSSFEEAAEAYISAMESKDAEGFIKCFPKDLRENVSKGIEASYGHSPYRFMEAEDGYLNYSYQGCKDMSQEELDLYNEKYSYKAKEGKYVEIKFSHSEPFMGGTATHSNSVTVPIVKIGRKWYALEPEDITGGWPLEY